jgi:tetratricopeptide (TPR) repeat protein
LPIIISSEALFYLYAVMPAPAKTSVFPALPICLFFALLLTMPALGQEEVLGSIVGRVRIARGDVPPQRILITLEYLGAPRDSVYTDSEGVFGFHNLEPGSYEIAVNDGEYEPVHQRAEIPATSLGPVAYADITLIPKSTNKSDAATPSKTPGSNPNMMDVREYSSRFPKNAVKEFKKGQQADSSGKRDDAIRHYEKAISISPDYYFAHNNLGSDYLSKSDFAGARREFEKVVELNQSDAAAYFNLSNVCMISGQLAEAGQYLDEGMRRQPDSAFGQFLTGSLDLRLGKFSEAESALHHAIQLDPRMVQARLQLINLFLKQGRREDAASQLRDFVNSFPESSFSAQAKQLLQKLEAHPQPAPSVPN